MSLPKTTDQWVVKGKGGFDDLVLEKDVQIPALGEYDVLVQVQAVSLNYRDLIIPQVHHLAYPEPYYRTADDTYRANTRFR